MITYTTHDKYDKLEYVCLYIHGLYNYGLYISSILASFLTLINLC